MSYTEKTKSFLLTLLKIILIIVSIAIIIIIGAYLYLKYALGIDVIDIKRKINLLNAEVTESSIISKPFTQEDAENGFCFMFEENNVYVKDGENYVFNSENFASNNLQTGGVYLNSQQFASCSNVFINNFVIEDEANNEVDLESQIKQIIFSNLNSENNKIKVDLDIVLKFNFSNLKNEFKNVGNFIYNIVSGIIPNYIYICAKAEVVLEMINDCQTCSVNPKKVTINNLSENESNEIFEILNRLSVSSENNMQNDLVLQFTDTILIGNGNNSFLNSIKGFNYFTFEKKNEEICIVLN